jgi:hypothetical protein
MDLAGFLRLIAFTDANTYANSDTIPHTNSVTIG